MVPHKFIPSIISQALVFGYLNNTERLWRYFPNFWRYFPTLYHYSHKPHSRPSLFISQRCDQMILLWKEQDYKEINEIMALWHRESLALANMTTTKWQNRADHLCINSSPNRTTHKLHRDLSKETMALKWKRQITINTTELTNSRFEHQLW
jgi:hypothetical protein